MLNMTIKRSEWTGSEESRRHGRNSALTLNHNGERCCLGHLAVAYNPDFEIWGADKACEMPHSVPADFIPEWLVEKRIAEKEDEYESVKYGEVGWFDTAIAKQLAYINDAPNMHPILKEALIAYTFEMYDVNVTFVD